MLEWVIIGGLALVIMALLGWYLRTLGRRSPQDLAERVQMLSEALLNLQRTLDARIDHSTQALNTSLVTGLTQLTTQLVSRVDQARLDSQIGMEERLQAVHRELQQQFETLRVNIQDGLSNASATISLSTARCSGIWRKNWERSASPTNVS